MKQTDTLVVGQGIAGTLVAYMLHIHEIPFVVLDSAESNTASRIAAGMFTPVSGKRKVVQPGFEQYISLAVETYKGLEQLLHIKLLHQHNIYQVFNSPAERIELKEKMATSHLVNYMISDPAILRGIKQEGGACTITHAGWIDCELMIESFRGWLKNKEAFIAGEFVYENLKTRNEIMEYQGLAFKHIIFCEGYRGINNPYFDQENIIPCKGDVITIQSDFADPGMIIKKNGIYLISLGNNKFKAGSTYHWNNDNSQPDASAKKLMEEKVSAILENDYLTTGHQSAIRPTTGNREIIAKRHHKNKGMFILNGLGTKGVLQGPWGAKAVVALCRQD